MKRTVGSGIGLLALAGLLVTVAAAQSLGEYARQQRAQKPAMPSAKVYTNDNLPTSGAISEIGQPEPPPPPPLSPKAAAAAQRDEQKKADAQKALETEWKAKFAEQKRNVAQLQRELDILVRENKLRQLAAFKNSAAPSASAAAELAAADQRAQAEIAEKQQALDDAKEKIETMKNELHQAGLPATWAE